MVNVNTRKGKHNVEEGGGGKYEESRAQTIKANMEIMKRLGITELSKQLKRRPPASSSLRKSKPAKSAAPSNDPPRRSSRLEAIPRVSYLEKKIPKKEGSSTSVVEIHIPEGENPEIYTDDHEKLLGDSFATWDLCVDGYDEDGQRIYDPDLGTSCHQCRQKTLGLHTKCSKCNAGTGQFCGDCLYMRYGENVTEVSLKQDWICPPCRGICNCSRCRRDKGWNPTGVIYNKAVKLGFKSVAHYLIHTLREPEAAKGSDPVAEKEGLSDAHPKSGAKEPVVDGENDGDQPVIDDGNEGDDRVHEEDGDSGSSSDKS